MDKYLESSKRLIKFLDANPSPFHVIDSLGKMYEKVGFKRLFEREKFEINKGENYFVTRNNSSIIAFRVPRGDFKGFNITSAHSDSPTFKIKANAEITVENNFVKLNVEKYGGMIIAPWFDRPLGIAGRVIIKNGEKIEEKLLHIDRDIIMMPSLAIHMNREVNDGYKYNAQKDTQPVFAELSSKISLLDIVAKELGVDKEAILDTDLFLTNRVKGTIWGANNEFIAAGRLDDLQCVFAGAESIIEAKNKNSIAVHCVFDNEEVGSGTKQGAASTFLKDILIRVNKALGGDEEDYLQAVARSFMVSADNAHSIHPNYTEKADPCNRPMVNKGVVIKYNANQKYTTDAVSGAVFKDICAEAKVPVQTFTNRSDVAGGSTLGNISNTQVSLNAVDIGMAQWAMHSPYESGGVKDTYYLKTALKQFFETDISTKLD
ncbi:MAG: M18 family aminopeptidase [Catonella sp.]|uniref:M18 family aminopeptidase n=1 Tax=Catonella sp. TaxID=2382125 RepID=UPI003FA17E61